MLVINPPEYKTIFSKLSQRRFARRLVFEEVKEPFLNSPSVNIQINNITFNESKVEEEKHIRETLEAMRETCLKMRKG